MGAWGCCIHICCQKYLGNHILLQLNCNIVFVDVLLHHKTKYEFIFCIDNAKVHQKAVL